MAQLKKTRPSSVDQSNIIGKENKEEAEEVVETCNDHKRNISSKSFHAWSC